MQQPRDHAHARQLGRQLAERAEVVRAEDDGVEVLPVVEERELARVLAHRVPPPLALVPVPDVHRRSVRVRAALVQTEPRLERGDVPRERRGGPHDVARDLRAEPHARVRAAEARAAAQRLRVEAVLEAGRVRHIHARRLAALGERTPAQREEVALEALGRAEERVGVAHAKALRGEHRAHLQREQQRLDEGGELRAQP